MDENKKSTFEAALNDFHNSQGKSTIYLLYNDIKEKKN